MSKLTPTLVAGQQPIFPETRYMGSKRNLLDFIWKTVRPLKVTSALDAFSGSSCVGQMLKSKGLRVISNDQLEYAYHLAVATIQNSSERLTPADVTMLLEFNPNRKRFIEKTFRGLYFSDHENRFLDNISANLSRLESAHKRSLALAALSRACIKRRPRGIFTYVGLDKYDDGRLDLRMGLEEHFKKAVEIMNQAVFDNGTRCASCHGDVFSLPTAARKVDLVYLDPPYVTPYSDNDYLRRYHFVEGLCSYWQREDLEILLHTKTKKLKRYETLFASKTTILPAFDQLFAQFPNSKLVVSYSSNGLPNQHELVALLKNHKRAVETFSLSHRYSFGNQTEKATKQSNCVEEYLFVAE